MSKKVLFLINPYAGKGEIKNKLVDILDIFAKSGYEVTVHITQNSNEIPDIILKKGHMYDTIISSGGDGTLNESVTGLMRLNKKIPLGYIPSGTVNDFASSLNIPKNMINAAEDIVEGKIFKCDVGEFGDDKYFSYVAAFGAFTDVAYRTPQNIKNVLGKTAYILEGIKSLPSLKKYNITIKTNNIEITDSFVLGLVTNTFSIAGIKANSKKMPISMDDGLLEVLLVKAPQSLLDMQSIINDILLRNFSNQSFYRFKTNSLKLIGEEPVLWTLDGEFGGDVQEVDIKVKKQALPIIVSHTQLEV